MVGHTAPEIVHHGVRHLVYRRIVRVDAKDLLPALPAGVLEVEVNVDKGLVDLGREICWHHTGTSIPAPCLLKHGLCLETRMYLSRAFDAIAHSDCLAVPEFFLVHSDAIVGIVGQVGRDGVVGVDGLSSSTVLLYNITNQP